MGSRKNILILIVLAVGLGLGLFLVSQPQIFKSRASVPGSVAFEGPNVKSIGGETVAVAPDIAIRMTTGFDSAVATPGPTSTPGTTTASPSPGSVATTPPTGSCPTDGSDGGSINANWLQTVPTCTKGDFSGDGMVDYNDFAVWYRQSGQTSLNQGGLVSEVSAQAASSGRKMFTTDGTPVTDNPGSGKTWAQASDEMKRQCIAAGKSTAGNVNETCSPDILSFIPAGWDGAASPDSMLVGVGNKLWWGASRPAGSSQRSYLLGTNVDTGANWTADAQMVQICATTGRSSNCKPDLVVNFPAGWDDGAEQVQLIGIGNRVWVRGSIDSTGKRTMYTTDNRPFTTDAGPGKTWAEVSPKEVKQQCIAAGKSTSANVNETCSPDVLTYIPANWDNFGNKPLMLVGIRDKVWVGESLPRSGTNRNWVVGTDSSTGVNWSADSQINQMCQNATGNSNCTPTLIANFPSTWDSFNEATQVISIRNKVWVRGKIQATGQGSACGGYVRDCQVDGQLGSMWCTPGVRDSENRCIEDAQNTRCYLEQGSTVRDTCKVIDLSLPAANYTINPAKPIENQPFSITVDGIAAGSLTSNVALKVGTNYYYFTTSGANSTAPYTLKSTGLAKGIYELQLVSGCKYTDANGGRLASPDCSGTSVTKFKVGSLDVGDVSQASFGTYKITESVGGQIVKEGTPQPMETKTVVANYTLSTGFNEKTITVEFTSPAGAKDIQTAKIKLISTAPSITSVDCNVDLASKGVAFTILGENLGTTQGKIGIEGQSSPDVKSWKDNSVTGLLPNNAGQEFQVILTRSDNQVSGKVKCVVGSQSLQFRANVFCQQIWPFDVPDVELTFIDRNSGGTEVPEKVTIDREGFVRGIKTKLQSGRNYALAIKAPKALRKVVSFTASNGTINLPEMILPVGDIAGENGRPDGKINAADRSALGADWRNLTVATTPRLADFNKDFKVNSVDWACMRKGFAKQGLTETGEDETLPKAGAQVSYKFSPDPLLENQDINISFEDPSPSSGTFDFVAMVVDGNYKTAQWLDGPGGGLVGPPYVGKITGGLPAGDHTFQLVGKCKYTDAASKTLSNPDCSAADVAKFEQVSKRVIQAAAPSKPVVTVTGGIITIAWTGSPGRGAEADTANKGKTGFYVDISNDNFTTVYNKFVETTASTNPSTTGPTGFVLANAGSPSTGTAFAYDCLLPYTVRVFNGVHSQTESIPASCARL